MTEDKKPRRAGAHASKGLIKAGIKAKLRVNPDRGYTATALLEHLRFKYSNLVVTEGRVHMVLGRMIEAQEVKLANGRYMLP